MEQRCACREGLRAIQRTGSSPCLLKLCMEHALRRQQNSAVLPNAHFDWCLASSSGTLSTRAYSSRILRGSAERTMTTGSTC